MFNLFKTPICLFSFSLLQMLTGLHAATLKLVSPLDYQVVQRETKERGKITVSGYLTDYEGKNIEIEARIILGEKTGKWHNLTATFNEGNFTATLDAPTGAWYRIEVRANQSSEEIANAVIEHVGIGEVFVIAGQSNSANHGSEKQVPKTGLVTAFNGTKWQIANDPQPVASGDGGSFIPPFGDEISEKFMVPVGFVSCGSGGTSVREWLPKGTRSPNAPTTASPNLPDGRWESSGNLYNRFVDRMKSLGPNGFRAVLWHQGESDANQADPNRTLDGKYYREFLEKIIRDSRKEISWEAPWFVAQVSYHSPEDQGSPDIRSAQASLWKDGIAFEGPDTDKLTGDFRDTGGKGIHLSGTGLQEHAKLWAKKVSPWLEKQK